MFTSSIFPFSFPFSFRKKETGEIFFHGNFRGIFQTVILWRDHGFVRYILRGLKFFELTKGKKNAKISPLSGAGG